MAYPVGVADELTDLGNARLKKLMAQLTLVHGLHTMLRRVACEPTSTATPC